MTDRSPKTRPAAGFRTLQYACPYLSEIAEILPFLAKSFEYATVALAVVVPLGVLIVIVGAEE